MFFRREQQRVRTFSDWTSKLAQAGFQVQSGGSSKARVSRAAMAANIEDDNAGGCRIVEAGLLLGSEVAPLVDQGYQKVFRTASGKAAAAQAGHLHALHAFLEDLREELEITSLYNESLGSTNELHLYDRIAGRDAGVPTRPWERTAK